MKFPDLLIVFFHWLASFLGLASLLLGLSSLPGLLDYTITENILYTSGWISLSKNILAGFPFFWEMIILVCAIALYSWFCFLFLFSSQLLVSTIQHVVSRSYEENDRVEWVSVSLIGIMQAIFFAIILYGTQLNSKTIALGLLILVINGVLFILNYDEKNDIKFPKATFKGVSY